MKFQPLERIEIKSEIVTNRSNLLDLKYNIRESINFDLEIGSRDFLARDLD